MVKATVQLNLNHLLKSGAKTIVDEFEHQLEREYSTENLDFWHAAQEYKLLTDGPTRLARAKQIEVQYITEGCDSQVVALPTAAPPLHRSSSCSHPPSHRTTTQPLVPLLAATSHLRTHRRAACLGWRRAPSYHPRWASQPHCQPHVHLRLT